MPALKGHRCQPLCCSEWTRGMEVRGHRATSSTSHTHSSYSRWPSLSCRPHPPHTHTPCPFIIIAQCFVKTFQRSCTSSALERIGALFSLNQLTRLHLSAAGFTLRSLYFIIIFNSFLNRFTHPLFTHTHL